MSIEIILGGLANKTSNTVGNTHCKVSTYNIKIIPITRTHYVTALEPFDQKCFDFEGIRLNSSQSSAITDALSQFKKSVFLFKNCVSSINSKYYYTLSKCLTSEILSFELDFIKCFEEANEVFEDLVFECLEEHILNQRIVLNLEET